jgi:autotransporter-associated beta strand protein
MMRNWWRPFVGRKAPSSRRAGRPAAYPKRFYRLQVEHLEDRLAPANHIWTGASAVDANWSTAANWANNSPPTVGETGPVILNFPGAPVINFPNGFTGASSLALNGGTAISGSALRLTDNAGGEARSAFTTTPIGTGAFTTTFTLQDTGAAQADGVSFVIQNDPRGTAALGAGGGGEGYAGIVNSIAVKFDLFTDGTHGSETGLFTGGTAPDSNESLDVSMLPNIDLHSGHPIQVMLTYDGTTLTEMVKDLTTNQTFSHTYTLNLAQVIGGPAAYVGFTGGTGVEMATQDVLNWTGSFSQAPVARMTNTDNIPNLVVDQINFTGSGYNIGGNPAGTTLNLSGGATTPHINDTTMTSPGTNTFAASLTIALNGTNQVAVTQAGESVAIQGMLQNNGATAGVLTKTGPGTLTLAGTNTYTGATTVNGGTLLVTGSTVAASAVAVNSSGTLGGTGTVGGAVTVASGGTVSPGVNGPGNLTVGSITFSTGSTLFEAINGNQAGQFDVLTANGPINLGGATLTGALGGGFNPTGGQTFLILEKVPAGAITGQFAAGSSVTLGGRTLTINYAGGDGNDVVLAAALVGTTTSLALNPTTSVFGQPVTFTATVTSAGAGTPTGTVTFLEGTTTLGTATLNSSGVATFTPTTPLSVGSHPITASYGGDTNFGGSTSTAVTETVAKAATTTSLALNPTTSVFGQPVTLTATVNVTAPGAGTPTGTVTFAEGTNVLGVGTLNSTGTATFTTAALSQGTHTITAVYSGDTNFLGATSTQPVTQVVNAATVGLTPNQCFVTDAYMDLLGRSPDPGGLAAWTALLDLNQATRLQVALGIENSPEYRMDVVQQLYQRLLRRAADPAGLTGGVSFLAAGGTSTQLEAVILASPEYFQTRGGGTNLGFLQAVYLDVLGRAIDPSGQQTFTQALNAGMSRLLVAQAILNSQEAVTDMVQALYLRILRRPADPSGLTAFVNAIQINNNLVNNPANALGISNTLTGLGGSNGLTVDQAAAALLASNEFFTRFCP